jgi:hypothetical protein
MSIRSGASRANPRGLVVYSAFRRARSIHMRAIPGARASAYRDGSGAGDFVYMRLAASGALVRQETLHRAKPPRNDHNSGAPRPRSEVPPPAHEPGGRSQRSPRARLLQWRDQRRRFAYSCRDTPHLCREVGRHAHLLRTQWSVHIWIRKRGCGTRRRACTPQMTLSGRPTRSLSVAHCDARKGVPWGHLSANG